ncbi:MAG: hypothetical protein KGL39_03645 [Patescibacteria group bacterium]|nr:hypothetical protein [Patescibacteria group bacterium]
MTTYSTNLLLQLQTPGDPAVTNAWGTNLNNGVFVLIDNAVAGVLDLSVAGSSNVILTSNSGSIDQSRQRLFVFSGALTGNITVFWPQNLARYFTVINNTSGSYTLTLAVNDGSGSAAGNTVISPQNDYPVSYYSDGTNIATLGSFGFGAMSTLASATTTDLGSAGTNFVKITGTTTITSFGSSATAQSPLFQVLFAGALTLTYNGTSLKIPGSANVTTAAGDTALCEYLGSGNWQVLAYSPAAGVYVPKASQLLFSLTGADFNSTSDQQLTAATGFPSTYSLDQILVTNASTSLTTAVGGFYTATSKGGTTVVPAAETYTELTGSTVIKRLDFNTGANTTNDLGSSLYFSLTTAQGATATADIYVFGKPLT